MRVVIVGSGHAGFTLATSLRERGHTGPISLVLGDGRLPYQRPPLSKAHLKSPVAEFDLVFRPRDYFERHDIDLVEGPVVRIDRDNRRVGLANSSWLTYDHLVLATGSITRRLGVPGENLTLVQGLHDAHDADLLVTRLDLGGRLVVIGAGFIGLEVAAGARAKGLSVTVLERDAHVMGRSVSPATGSLFISAHRNAGTRLLMGSTAASLVGNSAGEVCAVLTSEGEEIPADLVVTGVGAEANTTLAQDCGLTVDRGILVDPQLSCLIDPTVSAIGDCARYSDSEGQSIRLESVQNAVDQARYVAARLANPDSVGDPYMAVPWFWTEQLGLKLQIAGIGSRADAWATLGDVDGARFSVLCFAGGRLLAVESVNRPADHMRARRILAGTIPGLATITPERAAGADSLSAINDDS